MTIFTAIPHLQEGYWKTEKERVEVLNSEPRQAHQLRSVQWNQSATGQLSRRQNWSLIAFLEEDGGLSVIIDDNPEDDHREDPTVASLEEFARKDHRFHQITSMWFDDEYYNAVLVDASDPSQWTKIATPEDVQKCFRRILGRINFGDLDGLSLGITDTVGLHSAILDHLLDNDAKTRNLFLAYQGPASTEFLRRHVHKNELTDLHICEGWPLESTVPLVEALVRQRQLLNFWTDTRMNPSDSLVASIKENWSRDDTPKCKKHFVWKLESPQLSYGRVYNHPKSMISLVQKVMNEHFTLECRPLSAIPPFPPFPVVHASDGPM
uniref:Uncharacterized protein n=1 Tax=Steinernema glaseri TaxID=37863 RepID=A0A1I7YM57_9BILA